MSDYEGEHECSICGENYDGFGNNAWPFKGRCCDDCNEQHVLSARSAKEYILRCEADPANEVHGTVADWRRALLRKLAQQTGGMNFTRHVVAKAARQRGSQRMRKGVQRRRRGTIAELV